MEITLYDSTNKKTYTIRQWPTCVWLCNEEGEGMGMDEQMTKKLCEAVYNAIDTFFKEHH